jgi:hypothetical protein
VTPLVVQSSAALVAVAIEAGQSRRSHPLRLALRLHLRRPAARGRRVAFAMAVDSMCRRTCWPSIAQAPGPPQPPNAPCAPASPPRSGSMRPDLGSARAFRRGLVDLPCARAVARHRKNL